MVTATTTSTSSPLPGKGKSVLISGGSIAGPAIAWWLHKYGFETTIVERWHELRGGGQNIDLRGVGRDIITKMGLFDAVKARNTTEEGLQFIREDGSSIAAIPASANGPTAELEILRGDFAEVLYDATKEGTRYIFGDCIVAIDDEENGTANKQGKAEVTFKSGRKEEFDVVIIADGVRSRTRKLVFGDEVKFKRLGMSVAYATIPRIASDDRWAKWFTPPGRRSISTRPDPYNSTRVCLSFMTPVDYMQHDQQERIDILRRKFAGAGWEAERITSQLDQLDDLYCEDLMQVKAPRYSSGRVTMLGDAAFCATPVSGQGTTLSLSSAYILAAELAKSPDNHQVAFERYDKVMRPIAEKAQNLPGFIPGAAHPESWWGVAILRGLVTVVGWVWNLPYPQVAVDFVNRQGFGTDKVRVPEYKELQQ